MKHMTSKLLLLSLLAGLSTPVLTAKDEKPATRSIGSIPTEREIPQEMIGKKDLDLISSEMSRFAANIAMNGFVVDGVNLLDKNLDIKAAVKRFNISTKEDVEEYFQLYERAMHATKFLTGLCDSLINGVQTFFLFQDTHAVLKMANKYRNLINDMTELWLSEYVDDVVVRHLLPSTISDAACQEIADIINNPTDDVTGSMLDIFARLKPLNTIERYVLGLTLVGAFSEKHNNIDIMLLCMNSASSELSRMQGAPFMMIFAAAFQEPTMFIDSLITLPRDEARKVFEKDINARYALLAKLYGGDVRNASYAEKMLTLGKAILNSSRISKNADGSYILKGY